MRSRTVKLKRLSLTSLPLFTVLIFLLGSGCLRLEPIPFPQGEGTLSAILSWPDCVSIAEKEHPELLAAREAVKQARTDWIQSFEGFLPDASSTFKRTRQQVDDA